MAAEPKPLKEASEPMSEMPADLVYLNENGKLVTDSIKVAEALGKEHYNVLRDIRNLECSKAFRDLNFESIIKEGGVHKRKPYVMTRDGLALLLSVYSDRRITKDKEKLLTAFDEMKTKLEATQAKPVEKDSDPMPSTIIEPEIVDSEPMSEMPTDLVVQDEKGQPVTDSLIVAAAFGKEHKNVIQKIETLECSADFNRLNFQPVEYKDSKGEKRKKYEMTYKGFSFVALGFTGKRAAKYKEDFINAFEAMREKLNAQAAPQSELEVLVGVANNLLVQRRKLEEIEGKVAKTDEKMGVLDSKVAELGHAFQTNGCAKGFMPVRDARLTYGRGLSDGFWLQV